MTCGERLLKNAVEGRWKERRVIMGRVAMLTRPHNGRAACHYCGHCERGCDIIRISTRPAPLARRNEDRQADLRPDAVCSHVIVDSNTGKPRASPSSTASRRRLMKLYGKVVVLCASTIESTRLLLNSATRQYPNGLANNSSGALGHYLMDHTYISVSVGGIVPTSGEIPYDHGDGRNNGIYIPKFRTSSTNIRNSFAATASGPRRRRECIPRICVTPRLRLRIQTAGARKRPARLRSGWARSARCCRARKPRDHQQGPEGRLGIPVAHIECAYGDNEREMAKDQIETMKEWSRRRLGNSIFQPEPRQPRVVHSRGRRGPHGRRPENFGA